MILRTQDLVNKYQEYSDPLGKIHRMILTGEIKPLLKGLYETNPNIEGYKLAQFIYSPSYLSFDYALSYYSLIPEVMYKTYTCATLNKRKKKRYENEFGTYFYQDVPEEVFYYGIRRKNEDGYIFWIASKEKAICDKLYSLPPCQNYDDFIALLFDDLRIDEELLQKLNIAKINRIAPKYRKKNLDYLLQYFKELQSD